MWTAMTDVGDIYKFTLFQVEPKYTQGCTVPVAPVCGAILRRTIYRAHATFVGGKKKWCL